MNSLRLRASVPRPSVLPVLAASLLEWTGTGVLVLTVTLFGSGVLDLSDASIGAGLAVAGCVAMASLIPLGVLADRWGARNVLITLNLARALAAASYLILEDWHILLAVTSVVATAEHASSPLMQSIVSALVTRDDRVSAMAKLRTIANMGLGLGGLCAAASLSSAGEPTLRWSASATATLFAVAASIQCKLPNPQSDSEHLAAPRQRRRPNRAILALAGFDAVASLWAPLLNVGIPLWIGRHTNLTLEVVGVLYAFNTALCIALQVPLSRHWQAIVPAIRAYAGGVVTIALSCLGFASIPFVDGHGAYMLAGVSVAVLTIGEVLVVNSAWTLSFAATNRDGNSIDFLAFSFGRAASSRVVGPPLIAGGVIAAGTVGWMALACALVAAAALPVLAIRRLPATGGSGG